MGQEEGRRRIKMRKRMITDEEGEEGRAVTREEVGDEDEDEREDKKAEEE